MSPFSANSEISASDKPTSDSISLVCCPTVGAGTPVTHVNDEKPQ